jgi:serine/threonine protein kinase
MEDVRTVRTTTTALPDGAIILGGQYRVLRLLHQRPRVNLYLGKRLATRNATLLQDDRPDTSEGFVAIRELVLTGLSGPIRAEIELAAFEEFVSPLVPGSSRLPGAVERVYSEGTRHYLVMHLGGGKDEQDTRCLTLAQLLLSWREWPFWLQQETALAWGAQLCRIVARLHRTGEVLGDIDPTTVLVDGDGKADWVPMLLLSWPPPPQYLPHHSLTERRYQQIFPLARADASNTFAAPEMLSGEGDVRSDVYSLGAILYLLLTRYAPIAAARRPGLSTRADALDSMELIPPHRLNRAISARLSKILLRALAIEPEQRYGSVFELVEVIEAEESFWPIL